jgi:hypothetical protein
MLLSSTLKSGRNITIPRISSQRRLPRNNTCRHPRIGQIRGQLQLESASSLPLDLPVCSNNTVSLKIDSPKSGVEMKI